MHAFILKYFKNFGAIYYINFYSKNGKKSKDFLGPGTFYQTHHHRTHDTPSNMSSVYLSSEISLIFSFLQIIPLTLFEFKNPLHVERNSQV